MLPMSLIFSRFCAVLLGSFDQFVAEMFAAYQRVLAQITSTDFESYRKRKGLGIEIFLSRGSIPHEIQYLHAALMGIVEAAQGLTGGEVFLLRLVTAVTEYGMRQGRGVELYPKSSPSLQQTLRDYLNYALTFHLNVSLPDHLDNICIGDMRGYCQSAWERV